MFSNTKNVEINGKTVKSIILENSGILYEKEQPLSLSITSDKDILSYTNQDSATLTATLTKNNSPISNEQVLFYDLDRVSKSNNNIRFSPPLDFELILTTSDGITISPASYAPGTLKIVRAGGDVSVYRLRNDDWTQTTGVANPTQIIIPISNTEVISSSRNIPFFAMGITDSSGECSVVYDSKGIGDVTIITECMNLQEIYSIWDCKYYDECLSLTGHHNDSMWNMSSATFTRLDDYSSLTTGILELLNITDDCTVDFEIMQVGGTVGSGLFYVYSASSSTLTYFALGYLGLTSSVIGTWLNLRLKIVDGNATLSLINDSTKSKTNSINNVPNRLVFIIGSITEIQLRNVKIY